MWQQTVLQMQRNLTTTLMSQSASCWSGTSVQHVSTATSVESTQLYGSVVTFKCFEESDVVHCFPHKPSIWFKCFISVLVYFFIILSQLYLQHTFIHIYKCNTHLRLVLLNCMTMWTTIDISHVVWVRPRMHPIIKAHSICKSRFAHIVSCNLSFLWTLSMLSQLDIQLQLCGRLWQFLLWCLCVQQLTVILWLRCTVDTVVDCVQRSGW